MASFYETIFLKEDSLLEKRLIDLDVNQKNKKDIYMLQKGIEGEKQVAYHLNKANLGMYVLRDVNFSCDDMNAQVDFVVVTSHHCYFIECKNYSADIVRVDENRNFELSTKSGNKYEKLGIKSPISQVEDQLSVFKRLCLRNQDEVKELLNGVKFKDYFKTIVVFTNPENRLDLKKTPTDIKYRILKVDNIIRQIEYDQNHYNGKNLSKNQMFNIAEFILKNNVEVKVEKIEESICEDERASYSKSGSLPNKKTKTISKNKKNKGISEELINFCVGILILGLIYVFFGNSDGSNKDVSKDAINLTDNQIKAIDIMKSAFDDSTQNGFTIIHTSVCNEMSNMLGNQKFSCTKNPLIVNFVEENKITIYKNYTCYIFELSEDGKKLNSVISENKGFVENTFCQGVPVGYLEWDTENEYFNKIGGYDTILEIAIYGYLNNSDVSNFLVNDYISTRGGNPNLSLTYSQGVNKFFRALTGRGFHISASSTNKEETNKMCEYLYYIKK